MADTDSRWYTTTPATLKTILSEIPGLGTPDKVNSNWLATIGHGGGNQQSVLRVMKNVGLVEATGAPSGLWPRFKGGDKKALAEGIRAGYAPLFAVYPDAHQKDAEALIAFFRSNTSLAEKAQRLCVQTFQILCAAADFSDAAVVSTVPGKVVSGDPVREGKSGRGSAHAGGVALTVNIQLQLPPSNDGDVYDKLFEAMAKHLGGLIGRDE